jgi:hypothetical protein
METYQIFDASLLSNNKLVEIRNSGLSEGRRKKEKKIGDSTL